MNTLTAQTFWDPASDEMRVRMIFPFEFGFCHLFTNKVELKRIDEHQQLCNHAPIKIFLFGISVFSFPSFFLGGEDFFGWNVVSIVTVKSNYLFLLHTIKHEDTSKISTVASLRIFWMLVWHTVQYVQIYDTWFSTSCWCSFTTTDSKTWPWIYALWTKYLSTY